MVYHREVSKSFKSPRVDGTLLEDIIIILPEENFKCLRYADDIAIVRGRFAGIISEQIQRALNIVDN